MKTCQNNSCGIQIADQAAFCPKCGTPAPKVEPVVSNQENSFSDGMPSSSNLPPPPIAGRSPVPPPPPIRVVPPAPVKTVQVREEVSQTAQATSTANPAVEPQANTQNGSKATLAIESKKKSNSGFWAVIVVVVLIGLGYLATKSSSPPPVVTPPVVTTPPKVTAPVVTPPVNTTTNKQAPINPSKSVALTWTLSDQPGKDCQAKSVAKGHGGYDFDPRNCNFWTQSTCEIVTSPKTTLVDIGSLLAGCGTDLGKFLDLKGGDPTQILKLPFKNKTMNLELYYGTDVLQTCNRIAEKRGTEKFTDSKIPSCYFAVPAQNFCAIGMKTPQPNNSSMYDLGAVVQACFK